MRTHCCRPRVLEFLFGVLTCLCGAFVAVSDQALGQTEQVAANGSYTTSVEITVPTAPAAPKISLVYDSVSGGGVAGAGWDLSIGWPTMIARDTRFGTPAWKLDSDWLWGTSPLIAVNVSQCQQTGNCSYRLVPDNLTTVNIRLNVNPPTAEVNTPSGVRLIYEPIIYDGQTYPDAPAGASTKVLGFLLSSVTDPNGYSTCFQHKHFGDKDRGKVAVLDTVAYGMAPGLSCKDMLAATSSHRIQFTYNDLRQEGFFATWSLRFGSPVSFSHLLKSIVVSPVGIEQSQILLDYDGKSSETRRPRLTKIREQVQVGNNVTNERTLRVFAYGNRQPRFDSEELVDLGPIGTFPPSLVGSVSRPVRRPFVFNNPNGIFQLGNDQVDDAAPFTNATTEQWSWMDLNGDGLLDFQWGRESGQDPTGAIWPTFEPLASASNVPRPPQQLVRISEGIVGSNLATTLSFIDSHAPSVEQSFRPNATAVAGFSNWIWAEGQGLTRTGMPSSVSAPEIRNAAPVCPPAPGQDSRLWPIYPDGTFGGSQGSLGESASAASPFGVNGADYLTQEVLNIIPAIRNAYHPSYSVSSTLSGWFDLNGDGVPEFVVTPAWIERFKRDNLLCLGFARETSPASSSQGVEHGWRWHAAQAGTPVPGSVNTLDLKAVSGPLAPVGLPIDYNVSTGSPEGFGFTLPIGSAVSAGVSSLVAGSPLALALAVPGLIADSFSPRTQTGSYVSAPSPSAMGFLQSLAGAARNKNPTSGSIYNNATSLLKINYDLTLLSTTSRNRSETRSQLMDINADGLPDYLLYNSGDEIAGVSRGSLLAFLNSPSGFGAPTVINQGFDYQANLPDFAALQTEVNHAKNHAAALGALWKACAIADDSPNFAANQIAIITFCTPFVVEIQNMVSTAQAAIGAVEAFITSTTDAIPAERFHLDEVAALRTYLQTAVPVGTVLLSFVPAAAGNLNTAAQALETAIRMLERTVRQLGYGSRLNAISRGFSKLNGSPIGESAEGIAVQTRGFVDLNGDGLPDYVITSDREKSCANGEWEVFWGSGTSSIAAKRAFLPTPTCLKVPDTPTDVKDLAEGDLERSWWSGTLPLNIERIRRAPTADAQVVDTLNHSYTSLVDFNHDGRPDLVIGGDGSTGWTPDATSRVWSVFLNTGNGFESTATITINSPQTARTDIQPASIFAPGHNIPYQSVRTAHTDASITLVRDRSDTHAGLLDIDGDGTGEMVTRVKFTAADSTEHDGLFVWRRSSTGPQDYLLEDRYPIEGRRILVEYKPASHFQWTNALPDGQPPKDGHRALAGISGHLVRSVTNEPLMGRAELRTRTGYEYRHPYLDIEKRLPTGFALQTTTPLDPITGAPIAASILTQKRNAQRPNGVNSLTHVRQVIRGNGAPTHETLISHVERPTAGNTGALQAVFTAPVRQLSVEYPEGLTSGAIFDIGLDGREPFTDRVAGLATTSSPLPTTDPGLATGGAAVFNRSTPTPLLYPSPHLSGTTNPAVISNFTVEAWLMSKGTGTDRTVIHQPGSYRLSIVHVNGAERVQIEIPGTTLTATNDLAPGRWAHVVATYSAGRVKVHINGVEAGDAAGTGNLVGSGNLVIGCAQTVAGFDRCFEGEIGELRIYDIAWPHAARVTDTETGFQLDFTKHDFGQPLRVMERNDLATTDDDLVSEFTYANPSGAQRVLGAVATKAQRVLRPDGSAGNYLNYSELAYDGFSVGQIAVGNPTRIAQFDGSSEAPIKPTILNVVSKTEYDPWCPGRPTKTIDPDGFETLTEWFGSCSFLVSKTNELGHVATNHYYLNSSTNRVINGPYGTYRLTGRFGQLAEFIDGNGAVTKYGYDEWARETFSVLPLDREVRPSKRMEYTDAQCRTSAAVSVSCAHPSAVVLSSPRRVSEYTWDDQLDRCKTSQGKLLSCADPDAVDLAGDGPIGAYRVTHTFADGQVHAQTIRDGKPAWTVSGVKDYDAQGRIVRDYKVQYLPSTATSSTDPCHRAGSWCDSVRLQGNPLRHEVAAVQTAYDPRGSMIRLYGPEAPNCGSDPSALAANGQLACDALPDALGHATQIEYPSPGVVRTINARGVPTVNRTDVRGLSTSVEEYLLSSSTPYAVVKRDYDRLKRLVKTTDHQNNASTTHYDALGRVVATNDPDMGATSFAYHRRGLLKERIVANGDIARHTYDPLRRLTYSEYRRSKPGKLEKPGETKVVEKAQIDDCRFGTQFCKEVDFRYWLNLKDITRFGPISVRSEARLDRTQMSPVRLDKGDLDDGVGRLRLPFDVTLTPNALWTMSDDQRRNVEIIPGTNRFLSGAPIFVNTNGKIRFDSGGAEDIRAAEGTSLPMRTPEVALYPYYSNLILTDDGLRSAVIGTAPNRELVIQWSGALRAQPRQRVEFRTIIFEANSEIRYEYDVVPAKVSAVVGATNHSLKTSNAVVVRAVGEGGEPFVPSSGTAVTSQRKLAEERFVLEPLIFEGVPKATQMEFTVLLGEQGPFSLNFRHRWFSRCALVAVGSCKVDRMQVGYREPSDPSRFIVLIPPNRLISNASLDSATHDKAEEIIKVTLPDSLAGKEVTFAFIYDPVSGTPIEQRVSWIFDHINIQGVVTGQSATRIEDPVEEKVWRDYDSAESAFELANAGVLVNFTFDVPNCIKDRAATPPGQLTCLEDRATTPPKRINIPTVTGVSGRAIRMAPGGEIKYEMQASFPGSITTEAWVRPQAYPGTDQVLLGSNVFFLSLLSGGELKCEIFTTGDPIVSRSKSILPTDAWSHVALTYDGKTLTCYVNGAEDGSAERDPNVPTRTGTGFLIGDATGTVDVEFDEVRLFGSALSAAQILDHALRPLRAGPPKGNLVDIRFSDPNSRGQDSSKAGNNAILNGGVYVPGVQGAAFQLKPSKTQVKPSKTKTSPGLTVPGEVTIPHSNTLEIPEAVTVELWIKTLNKAKGPAQLIQKGAGSGPGWRLGLEMLTGQLRWEVQTLVSGPKGTKSFRAIFVTYESVNDDIWHHVAATYDGQRLRVFIDGIPAHRTCVPLEATKSTPPPCIDLPPPDRCTIEVGTVDSPGGSQPVGDAVCSEGTIANTEPVRAGSGLDGVIDELRVSNYAKREFEVAASSRLASAYTQVLGREIDVRNELPVGTQVAREVRAYNVRGELVSTWKRINGQTAPEDFLARYAMDTVGRQGSREYPNGEVAVSRFDHTGLQTGLIGYGPSIAANGGRQNYLDTASATVNGLIQNINYGNKVSTSFSYEDAPKGNGGGFGADRLRQAITHTGNTTLSHRTYGWDVVGNLDSVVEVAHKQLNSANSQQYSATYVHDDLNRIKTATFQVGTQSLPAKSYDPDSIGNLRLKDGVTQEYGRANSLAICGPRTTTIPHAITKRKNGATEDSYCYDEIGRLVLATDNANNSSRSHTYYARGTLSRVSGQSDHDFRYDGNGTRVAKTEPDRASTASKRTVEPYGFYREIPNGTESLYSANGQLITRRTGSLSSDVLWYHLDHLGGTNFMTDSNGTEDVLARSHYLPFGEFLIPPEDAPQEVRDATNRSGGRQFTGKELDETGYYDFGARYYDPTTGRFIQPDPIIPDSSTQAYNRFSYTVNNPLRFVDPSGHRPELYEIPAASSVRAQCNSCSLNFPSTYSQYDTLTVEQIWNLPDRQAREVFQTGIGIVPKQLSIANIEMRETYNAYVSMIPVVASVATPAFSGVSPSFLGTGAESMFAGSIRPGARTFASSDSIIIDGSGSAPNVASNRSTVPLPNPGEGQMPYGTRTHQEFPRIIGETNPGAGGQFNVAPGLTGPDLANPTRFNATFGEMKSLWGRQSPMVRQASKWGFDAQTGRYFFYDRTTGHVFEGIIQTEKFPRGGFR